MYLNFAAKFKKNMTQYLHLDAIYFFQYKLKCNTIVIKDILTEVMNVPALDHKTSLQASNLRHKIALVTLSRNERGLITTYNNHITNIYLK